MLPILGAIAVGSLAVGFLFDELEEQQAEERRLERRRLERQEQRLLARLQAEAQAAYEQAYQEEREREYHHCMVQYKSAISAYQICQESYDEQCQVQGQLEREINLLKNHVDVLHRSVPSSAISQQLAAYQRMIAGLENELAQVKASKKAQKRELNELSRQIGEFREYIGDNFGGPSLKLNY